MCIYVYICVYMCIYVYICVYLRLPFSHTNLPTPPLAATPIHKPVPAATVLTRVKLSVCSTAGFIWAAYTACGSGAS